MERKGQMDILLAFNHQLMTMTMVIVMMTMMTMMIVMMFIMIVMRKEGEKEKGVREVETSESTSKCHTQAKKVTQALNCTRN